MSHTLTFRDGSKLEVIAPPHDDGADRLVDLRTAGDEEVVVRDAGQGWVAVTSLEPDRLGNLEHVAHWIDAAQIVSVT